MWYDALRKYDECPGVEVFTWNGKACDKRQIGDINPWFKSNVGDLYSFVEYDRCVNPIWRVVLRSNGNDTYLWTTTRLFYEIQRVNINGAVIFLRDAMTIIIEENNIMVYAGQIDSLDRIEATEVKALNNVSAIIQKLNEYGYKLLWFDAICK